MAGIDIRPVGDGAVLATLGTTVDLALVRQCHALAAAAQHALGPAALDVVPAYASVLVRFDPIEAKLAEVLAAVRGAAELVSAECPAGMRNRPERKRSWKVGVCFGGQHGPDLTASASELGLAEERFVSAFCAAEYTVAFLGYIAGFPYLVGLPDELARPRLAAPRRSVPAGSVGIASRQCGIYPRTSPGGWRLLGRTSATLFDARRDPAALFAPGDEIRFTPVSEFEHAVAKLGT